jgi:hypothetical protein
MNNALSKLPNPNEQTIVAQTTYNAPNGNQFFGTVGAVNSTSIFVNGANGQQQIQLSTEYCNIFIIKDEAFVGQTGSFTIPRERAQHIKKLSDEAKAEIVTFPSLFMDTNKGYRRCANASQQFFYGLVTHFHEQGNYYKVFFQKLSVQPLFQSQLNENAVRLGINTNDGRDVLDETAWLIKRLDLRRALMSVGIYL